MVPRLEERFVACLQGIILPVDGPMTGDRKYRLIGIDDLNARVS